MKEGPRDWFNGIVVILMEEESLKLMRFKFLAGNHLV